MTGTANIIAHGCPTDEIAAYIDGELDAARETELDAHFDICNICSHELSEQKLFLCNLSSSLKNESDLELPANFTRTIVANAESTVSGLRRPRERFNAVFICTGLFLFVLFAMGTGTGNLLDGMANIFEKLAAVIGFLGHLVFSTFLGLAIILRSLVSQFRFDASMAIGLSMVVTLLLMFLSRTVIRLRRV